MTATTLLALAAGAFLGGLALRLADALRANLQLRTARLTALEARTEQCEGDMLKLGQQGNGLVTGLQAHDNELARLAFKLGMARNGSPLDTLDLQGPTPSDPKGRARGR